MVKKIRYWYASLDDIDQVMVKSAGQALLCFAAIIVFLAVCIGCAKKVTPKQPVAKPATAAVDADGYALDPAFKPDVLCLRPGQSAEILEDVEVKARIPYREDERELWVGRVLIQKGSMVVKPMVEGGAK